MMLCRTMTGGGGRVYIKRMSNLMKRFEEGRQTDVESELDDQPRSQPGVDEMGGENNIILFGLAQARLELSQR